MSLSLVATSTFGLEAVVMRELAALGYESRSPRTGRIDFSGDAEALARANLWLRSADRVLLRLAEFETRDFDELFEGVRCLEWDQWIPADGAFPVSGRSLASRLESVPAVQRTVKKAVVEALQRGHAREDLPETGATFPVAVELFEDRATLYLDTSGEGLHKRGYRDLVGAAPLRETLAAALVELSFWKPGRPFLDPFCGTGTLAIEAALLGRRLAPGRDRSFLAERWPFLRGGAFGRAREEASDLAREADFEPLLACDIDEGALSLARRHAARAGVAANVRFERRAFEDTRDLPPWGALVTNPPWGVRLDDHATLEPLYDAMAGVFARLPTWSFFVLTPWPRFEATVGRRAERRRKLYNARVECTYYQFHGPRPPRAGDEADAATTAQPAFAPAAPGSRRTARSEEFANRLRKVDRHRRRWPGKRGVSCYRVYDGDLPQFPLVVERFGDAARLAPACVAGRPPIALATMIGLAPVVAETLELPPAEIFVAGRPAPDGGRRWVAENGIDFVVDLDDERDSGLDLAGRGLRGWIGERAGGRVVLDGLEAGLATPVIAIAAGARSVLRYPLGAARGEGRLGTAIDALGNDARGRLVDAGGRGDDADASIPDLVLLDLAEVLRSRGRPTRPLDAQTLEELLGRRFAPDAEIVLVAKQAVAATPIAGFELVKAASVVEDCQNVEALRVFARLRP